MASKHLWSLALGAALFTGHAHAAPGKAYFDMLAGEHNVVACLLHADAPDRRYQLTVGVSPDPDKPQLMGKVRLRQLAGHSSGQTEVVEMRTALGKSLLHVALHKTEANTLMADLPATEVAELLRTLTQQSSLQISVGQPASQAAQPFVLQTEGPADQIHACLKIIERDNAAQQPDPGSAIQDTASAMGYYRW
ncbi:MAG: hypothetical protein ABW202_22015 [Duganella sp.]